MMIDASGNRYYYYYDGLGSVAALSNTSGTIVEGYTYDAFGNVAIHTSAGNDNIWLNGDAGTTYDTSSTGSPKGNPTMFTARRLDPETRDGSRNGLYYYRARMYYPELGRFMQTDPIGYYDSMNLYQYCGNNSVNFIDPFGEEFFFLFEESAFVPRWTWDFGETAGEGIEAQPSALPEAVPAPPVAGPTGEPLTPENDKCPNQRKGGGKNDKHKKDGGLKPSDEKLIKRLQDKLDKETSGRIRKQLKKKIDNIKKNAEKPGENHSQKAKGSNGMKKGYNGGYRVSPRDWRRGYIERNGGRIPIV